MNRYLPIKWENCQVGQVEPPMLLAPPGPALYPMRVGYF